MIEKHNIAVEPKTAPQKFTRRDFLYLAGLSGAATLGRKVGEWISGNDWENRGPYSKMPIRMVFGNHFIKQGLIQPNTAVLSGELDLDDLETLKNPRVDEVLALEGKDLQNLIESKSKLNETQFQSTYTTFTQVLDHLQELKKAEKQGSIILLNDGFTIYSRGVDFYTKAVQQGEKQYLEKSLIGSLLTAALIFKGDAIFGKNWNTFVDSSIGLLAGNHFVEAIDSGQIYLNGNMANFQKWAQKILLTSQNRDLANLINITSIRTRTMALNLHIGQQMLDAAFPGGQSLEKFKVAGKDPEILFFSGDGHVGVKSGYRSGVKYLSYELTNFAEEIVNYFHESLISLDSETPEAIEKDLSLWAVASSAFSYPVGTFMNNPEYLEMNFSNFPYSPRALMWKTFLKAMEKSPKDWAYVKMAEILSLEEKTFSEKIHSNFPYLSTRQIVSEAQDEINFFAGSEGRLTLKISDGIPTLFKKFD